MPTLLNKNGFKFFFYANEHESKHIHIMKGEGFAKVELESLKVVQNYLRPKDLKMALEITKNNKEIVINADYGLGEKIVDGKTNPKEFILNKNTFFEIQIN